MHFNMQGKTAYPKVSANNALLEFGPLELKPKISSNGRAITAAKANVAFDTKFQRLNPRSGIMLLFSIWRANNTGNSARSAPTVAPLNKQMAEKINPSPSAKNVAPKNEIIDKSIDIFKILKTP